LEAMKRLGRKCLSCAESEAENLRLRAQLTEQAQQRPIRMSELAELIARRAHVDQVDTVTGAPYIHHVERVAAMVEGEEAKTIAWLHDVIEDTTITEGDLIGYGFPNYVVNGVLVLTRGNETYEEYIGIVREQGSASARQVKLADLRDHLQPNCPERLRPRYEKALAALRMQHVPRNQGSAV
jgi:(p)ppGpp synthase/HD superfamily hydrolase